MRRRVLWLVMAVVLASGAAGRAQGVAALSFGGRDVAPGTRIDLDLPVLKGASDPETFIPVTVFHGARPGPRLVITAGVHGYEYPPILAAQQLLTRIDPAQLAGTVILVRLAHVSAFEQRGAGFVHARYVVVGHDERVVRTARQAERVLQFRDGRAEYATLGGFPAVSVSAARVLHAELIEIVRSVRSVSMAALRTASSDCSTAHGSGAGCDRRSR